MCTRLAERVGRGESRSLPMGEGEREYTLARFWVPGIGCGDALEEGPGVDGGVRMDITVRLGYERTRQS